MTSQCHNDPAFDNRDIMEMMSLAVLAHVVYSSTSPSQIVQENTHQTP